MGAAVFLAAVTTTAAAGQDVPLTWHGGPHGVVRGRETGEPVPYALVAAVYAPGGADTMWTGPAARYAFNWTGRPYRLAARACRDGLASDPVAVADTTGAQPLDLLVSVAGCPPPPGEAEYRGYYEGEFESLVFVPCGAPAEPDHWWVDLPRNIWERDVVGPGLQWRSAGTRPGAAGFDAQRKYLYVRWRARLSPEGHYGHFSCCSRLMTVTRVLELRAPSPADCRR